MADLSPLPAGVHAETFTYANGQQVAVYRAPYRSDGPLCAGENGDRVLYYMFAEYVFRWPEGDTRVDIGHGRIGKSMSLCAGVTITGRWTGGRLVEFAQSWVSTHLKKYEKR